MSRVFGVAMTNTQTPIMVGIGGIGGIGGGI
jgi:hypothetical protein